MVDPISGTFSQLLNTINRNRSGLQNSLERIASGRKLNRAGTDPAASALSAQLHSDISALTQSVKNVESGTNFVRTAGRIGRYRRSGKPGPGIGHTIQ
jgi:flagellin